MTTRFGDAGENGNEHYDNDQLQQQQQQRQRQPSMRGASKGNRAPAAAIQPHHGFVFKAFTRESLINIQKRKSSKAKKHSATYLDPANRQQKLQPDPYLASGQQLPPALIRQMPSELLGKPIEDIDPYYADQETFVIISRGKELTRFSATKALGLLGPFHPLRRVVLYILVNPLFNLLVILTILINCILMTIQGSETVEKTEIIFTIVYTTEMGLKVLARGFIVDHFTYLRDPWNWLDFAVIIMAYLTIVVQDLGNLSVIRTFRVLRALKTVAIIPGMKTIVGAVIDSVKNLKDVVVLTLFSLSVFSLLGLQIYMGLLTQKCISNGPNNMSDTEWYSWCNDTSHWVKDPDSEIFGAYRLCGNATGAQSCPPDHTCLQGFGPNPDYGYTSFDTFGWALICSFRLMTQDFWEGLYMQVLKTAGSWHIIFFIVSIFLGSIYLMNLILAIVAMSYNELQRRAEEEEEAAAEDEAAFLESCRMMELQERMSDFSSSTQGGGQTSYRPSVEIGMVGQNLLASLCQNGLLGEHVRNQLNQQMMLPQMAASASNGSSARARSLSVNLGRQRGGSSSGNTTTTNNNNGGGGGDGGVSNTNNSHHHHKINLNNRSSMVPNFFDPTMMVSSMTELRRKSSGRTDESESPTRQHLLPLAPTASSVGGHRLSGQIDHHHHRPSTSARAYSRQQQQHQAEARYAANRLSPLHQHHVSSGVLTLRPLDHESPPGGGHRKSLGRPSTVSDRDIDVLRQRAARIRIGNNLTKDPCGAISSIDSSDPTEDTELSPVSQRLNAEQPARKMRLASLSPSWQATRRTMRRRSGFGDSFSADSADTAHFLSVGLKSRTKSQEYSIEQAGRPSSSSQDEGRDQQRASCDAGCVGGGRSNSDYFIQRGSKEFRSEAAICKQPISIHLKPAMAAPPPHHTAGPLPPPFEGHGKRRSASGQASPTDDNSITSNQSCIEVRSVQQSAPASAAAAAAANRRALIGGSTRTLLHSDRPAANPMGPSSGRLMASKQLAVDRYLETEKMHHLSVENFQQFGAARPSFSLAAPLGEHSTTTRMGHRSGSGMLAQQMAAEYAATGAGTSSMGAAAATAPKTAPGEPPEAGGYFEQANLRQRSRLDSRGYIHPTTMMRSSFARPRQSVVVGTMGGSSSRKLSQDFVRRASDWSRLSMSANVDLRRLLRLWAHTNPYQGRPSVGSFSNYSQAAYPSVFESPADSVKDFGGGGGGGYPPGFSLNNSSRPSSVSSARQAYELISAFSRRHNRFPSDQRYALPLDDSVMDKMSVNMRDRCLAYCLSCLDVLCIWECCGAWLKMQKIISIVVFDPFTELFIILCILINTLFMALDSDDADAHMKSIFERGNYFFTATFAVEASMKIMALSPKFYFREGWNVFDAIIVGLSLLELGLEGVYGLSVLRSFRLLRVFKLAKSWPTLNLLISIMGKAVGDLGNLTFVLAIIVFIFAVMGMQLFGNKYVDRNFPSGELPRWNFTDFMHSFMIVFRILCAEWIEPMWDCLLVGGWPCIPFFLIAVTVGNLVVLNLFLALLLASFGASNLSSPQADNVDTKKLQEAIGRFSRFARWLRRLVGRCIIGLATCYQGKRGHRGSGASGGLGGSSGSNHRGRGGRPVKSHIAAMSKLERLKNIEQRTEELKSKIRRSPEHHYHLRQLAQSQLRESVQQKPPPPPGQGFNFNYKRKGPAQSGTGGGTQVPTIPIIVKDVSDGDTATNEDEKTEGDAGGAAASAPDTHSADSVPDSSNSLTDSEPSTTRHVECVTDQQRAGEEDDGKQQVSSGDPLFSCKMRDIRATNPTGELASSAQAAGVKQIVQRFPGYSNNMQSIKEDSRDAESNTSQTSAEVEAGARRHKSLDKLAQDEASHSSNRWKLAAAHHHNHHHSHPHQMSADDDHHQRRVAQYGDEMLSAHERLIKQATIETSDQTTSDEHRPGGGGGGDCSLEVGLLVEQEPGGGGSTLKPPSNIERRQAEDERPKSSLYLKAPKREDMEEEDEQALQHIESYIEKCICIGIVCLKWFLFRQYVRKIVEHKYFDQCILVLIVISSGTLALEDKHLNERPNLKRTLDVLDTIFTIIFSLEMIFKWLAFGMKRYFGNIWSWLDFVIVLVSFVNLMASIFGSGKIQALKTMRTLRAMRGLRPLRALQRFQGMRVVVNALIQAIPSIFNVLLVCLIFWLIFSIMGVQMFGGKFWRCLSPITHEVVTADQAANRIECIERNLTWANPQINFDNVLNAYLALFQVATFKGWIDIMNSATDSRMRDDQPMREANIYMYFYFVFFVIFGSFFTLNLFIGVIIDNFNEQKKKTGGSLEIFMTDDQKKYYHAMKKMRSKRPVKAMTRPKLKLQAYMFDITTNKKFDMVIMIIIGLNMLVMALEHYGQSQEFSTVLENLNLIFIAIFTLECLCKIFAMRHFYFREPWNIFDFIVVDMSILGVIMKEYVAKYLVSPTLLRVVRVVKVGRVLRLVKGAKGIRTLLFALAMSLPALFNICLLLFLVMFIYAIFGMSFFMNVRKRSGIDETFNFETFSSSIIVLFQMSTSAGWDLVLDPLMDEENDCTRPDPVLGGEDTCGNKGIAIAYLISYVIVTFLIIINMYIAVILENYSQATEDVQEGLTDDDYEMYYEIWQKFDPDGTQYLPFDKLSDFVDALEDPLRIPKPNDLALVVLDINIYAGNQCYCVDILDALTKYFFTRKGLIIQVNEHLQKVQSTLHETPFERITTTYLVKRQHYCARIIQNCWRKWRKKTLGAERRASLAALNKT